MLYDKKEREEEEQTREQEDIETFAEQSNFEEVTACVWQCLSLNKTKCQNRFHSIFVSLLLFFFPMNFPCRNCSTVRCKKTLVFCHLLISVHSFMCSRIIHMVESIFAPYFTPRKTFFCYSLRKRLYSHHNSAVQFTIC